MIKDVPFKKKVINEVSINPVLLDNVISSVQRRAANCIELGRGHFQQHVLQMILIEKM